MNFVDWINSLTIQNVFWIFICVGIVFLVIRHFKDILTLCIWVITGYLMGTWLNPDIMAQHLQYTDWTNIWVYAWMFLWPFGLIWHFLMWSGWVIMWTVVAVVVVFVAWFGAEWFKHKQRHNEWIARRGPPPMNRK